MRPVTLALAASLVAGLGATTGAIAAGPYDGVWRGTRERVTSNNSASCESTASETSLRIVDSRFNQSWGPAGQRQTIEVTVKPDGTAFGSVSAMSPSGRTRTREYTFSGKITGDTMVAELGSSLCAVRLTLKRVRS